MCVILAKENILEQTEVRDAYCSAIIEMIENGEPVVAMDADLMRPIGLLPYRNKYPNNIIECGISEANMFGMAAGLSAEGFVPFPHTFGVFASRRACDQIYISGAYAKQNIKIVGSDPGAAAGLNGGTHAALEDIAIMRAIPGMTIVEPSDSTMAREVTFMAARTYGMFYIRLFRTNAVKIYEEGSKFEFGKAVMLRDGQDVTLLACGMEVAEALKAAEILEKDGISVRVLDMFTIKPLDVEAVKKAAMETGAIVTCENHNIIGGLGSAVSEVVVENYPVPVERVGVKDRFGEVGPTEWLIKKYKISAVDIVEKAKLVVMRKKNKGVN